MVATWTITHHPYVPGINIPYHNVVTRLPSTADPGGERRGDLFIPGSWCGSGSPVIGAEVQPAFEDVVVSVGTTFTLLGWIPTAQHN